MKVILINPPFNISKANYDSSISVGLLCLGSYLDSRGIQVKLIDGARQEDWEEILRKEIGVETEQYSDSMIVVGLSVMTTQVNKALEISRLVRELKPQAKIVWGGVHATLFPEQTLGHKLVDYVVMNEGEATLEELVSGLGELKKSKYTENNTQQDKPRLVAEIDYFKQIKGLGFKVGNRIFINQPRPFLKMDNLPLTNWDLLDKNVLERLVLVPAHTSRGCPHRCAFCINTVTRNKWRGRSQDKVLREIEIISSKEYFWGKPLRFWDEDFFALKIRARGIVKGIMALNDKLPKERKVRWDVATTGLPWETTVRADYFRDSMIDDEFLKDLNKSGCYLLSFGAESGSQRILDKITKDVKVGQIVHSAKQCLKHGITPQYSFMVGLPGEERSDMNKTMKLVDELVHLSPKVQILGPQAFRPYPGSKLYDECLAGTDGQPGWQEPGSLEEWSEIAQYELNYLNPHHFPWIKKKNRDLVDAMEAYVRFGAHTLRSAMGSTVKAKNWLKLAFVLICKLRWQIKFFKWPIEYKLAKRFIAS